MVSVSKKLRAINPKVDINIFRSVENINLNTVISYVQDGKVHHFLDDYKEKGKIIDSKIDEEMIAKKEKKFMLEMADGEFKAVDNTTMKFEQDE